MARALLAARNAHADELQTRSGESGKSPDGVAEIGIAGIDDDVARRHQLPQPGDLFIDRIARLHHDNDGARRLDSRHKLRQGLAGNDALRQGAGGGVKFSGGFACAVIDRDGKALLGDIERQIGTHHAQSDHADFRPRHLHTPTA